MDFSWSEEQIEKYRRIVRNVQASAVLQKQKNTSYWTRSQWRYCGELGLLGLSVPHEYRGQNLGALETAHLFEAFGYSCPDMGLVFSAAAHLFACCMPIAEQGDRALREQVLSGLCSGELV